MQGAIRMSTLPRVISLLSGLGALGCARVHVVPAPSAVQSVAPEDAPLSPYEAPRPRAESMNTEYYLGSEVDEAAGFNSFAEQIQAIQNHQSASQDQPVQRGFHGKGHGCLQGTMTLLPDRDPRTRFGVFADEHDGWPVWVRFSNGVGWKQADRTLDARGMAVKLMGVPGEKLIAEEAATQDFLMTNSPAPVGRNAEEFMRFAHTNSRGKPQTIGYALTRPRTVLPAVTKTSAVDSMLAIQYWSGGAYHLGAHQAVKFSSRACEVSDRTPSRKDPDYLRTDLQDAAQEELCFTFFVQLQVDAKRTPIEDAARVWKTSVSPELPVAEIRLPAQDFTSADQDGFCDALSFNPWHGISAHQPMGHINRARRFVYEASRTHRDGGLEPQAPVEPAAEPVPAAEPDSVPPAEPEVLEDTAPLAP
jgi:hypothetical protein